MTLSQRPGARFFAAFYRWSRYTQSPALRSHTVRYRHNAVHVRPALYTSRNFSCARLRRQQSSENIDDTPIIDSQGTSLLDQLAEEGQRFKDASLRGVTLNGGARQVQEAQTTEEAHMRNRVLSSEQEVIDGRPGMKGESHTLSDTAILKGTTVKELLEQEEQELDQNASPEALQQSVRHIMRHVPSSVAVITAACVDSESNSQVPLGIAVSSLSTVTLDPPTISFNVRYPSRTLDAIKASDGRFRVHFLDSGPHGAAIANLFTKGNSQQALGKRQQAARITLPASPFPPQILDPAVVAALECKVSQEFTVADHIIIVAKVSDSRGRNITESTLSYVQGDYVQKDGSSLQTRKEAIPPTKSRYHIKSHPLFSLPLFPGERERDTFIERIKSYLEVNPQVFRLSLREAAIEVRYNLNIRGGTLGVSLVQVIAEVAALKGHKMKSEHWQRDLPIKSKFYGPLSSSDISSIVDMVKQLVHQDLSYLSVNQEKLFVLLGIDPLSTGMLASDILDPLREDNIIPPFDYTNSNNVRPKGGEKEWVKKNVIPDLVHLERVEHQVRRYLQTHDYDSATRLNTEELARNAVGEIGWVKTYIGRIQARLYVETFPDQFDASNIDISGQLSNPETRVVLRRIFSLLAHDGYHHIKDYLNIPWYEMLRRVNVHPLIQGIDIEFLYYKLRYFLSFNPDQKAIREYMTSLAKPWFRYEVDMKELEALVEDFAEMSPMRVISWRRKDWLAAMGLDRNARVLDPATSDFTGLLTGYILPRLLNAALEKRYGVGKEREMEAVIKYLQQYSQRRIASPTGVRIRKQSYEPRHPPVSLHYDGLVSDTPGPPSVIRKHAAAQLLSPEQQQVAESIKGKMAKRRQPSDIEHKHLNFAEELLDLAGKSHGFKAYGLDGERKQ